MTGTMAYILSKKIALGAVSGIKSIVLNGNQLVFNFTNGTSTSMTIPLPKDGVDGKDGKDGLSIINVAIDSKNHLICTLSDNSTVDAGEIPGGNATAGGLIQVPNFASLTYPGEVGALYITLDNETIYYWDDKNNLYKPVVTNGVKDEDLTSVDLLTDEIIFDGVSDTFDLPVDNTKMVIHVNGMQLKEDIDYTIDRNVTPNTITFMDIWESTDSCTLLWIKGNILDPGQLDKVGLDQLKTDITSILEVRCFINEEAVFPTKEWSKEPVDITGGLVYALSGPLSAAQKELAKIILVLGEQTPETGDPYRKIVGVGLINSYDETADKFSVTFTKYGEGVAAEVDLSLADKTDIDKLFDDNDLAVDLLGSTLATKPDIDNLFNDDDVTTDPDKDIYAKEEDIDNLFNNDVTIDPTENDVYAKEEDVDKLFSDTEISTPDVGSLATE